MVGSGTTTRIGIGCLTIFGIAGLADAATRHVPAQHASIQAAINASSDGDVVVVAPGTYYEAIDMDGKGVHLRGSNPADWSVVESTVIDASPFAEKSVILCNSAEGADTIVEGLTLRGGTGTKLGGDTFGGGMYIYNGAPTVRRCIFEGNEADAGGGLSMKFAWSVVSECVFRDNYAQGPAEQGGGGLHVYNCWATFSQCAILDNEAFTVGGGVSMCKGSALFDNCIIARNQAYGTSGLVNDRGTATIINCTVADNTAQGLGAGLFNMSMATMTVRNSVVAGNLLDGYPDNITAYGTLSTYVYDSLVEGGFGLCSTECGIIDEDPQFADAAAGDYRLAAGSPAIDRGDNDQVACSFDLDGNDRIYDDGSNLGVVDLGAYEHQGDSDPGDACATDLDGNGTTDFDDLIDLLSAWGECSGACAADLDGDGAVQWSDLMVLLVQWGPCA